MELSLSNYAPADFETLYAIDQACYPRGIAYSRPMLREFLSLPGAECQVARVHEGKGLSVAGFIIGEIEGSDARIITIDVLEAHRRKQVGTALLQSMEEQLALRGARRIELETATTNAAGVAFWERHGYRKTGVLRDYYPGRLDAWKMRKSLAAAGAGRTSGKVQ